MPSSSNFNPVCTYDLTTTIASGQTTTDAIDLSGTLLAGLIMPASFTGSLVGIQMSSAPNGTYVTVQAGGADFYLPVAASKFVPVENFAVTAALRFIKLVSNAAEGADRVITLATRPVS